MSTYTGLHIVSWLDVRSPCVTFSGLHHIQGWKAVYARYGCFEVLDTGWQVQHSEIQSLDHAQGPAVEDVPYRPPGLTAHLVLVDQKHDLQPPLARPVIDH